MIARCAAGLADLRAALRGVRAGLRTPGLLRAEAWEELLEPAGIPRHQPAAGAHRSAETARRWAVRTVAALGRLPLFRSTWRNTCLFRSVAACRALRDHGVASRLRIGAAGGYVEGGPVADLAVHAWVEMPNGDRRTGALGRAVTGAGPVVFARSFSRSVAEEPSA